MPDLAHGEGYTGKAKEYYEEAKKQAVAHQRSSTGAVVFAIMMMAFVYVTRRRFAGTLRSMRRT
jgi:mannosyl-oligosaccharide glucosidase